MLKSIGKFMFSVLEESASNAEQREVLAQFKEHIGIKEESYERHTREGKARKEQRSQEKIEKYWMEGLQMPLDTLKEEYKKVDKNKQPEKKLGYGKALLERK